MEISENYQYAYMILSLLMPHLSMTSIQKCRQICKLWNQIIQEPTFLRIISLRNNVISLDLMPVHLNLENIVELYVNDCKIKSTNSNIIGDMPKLRILEWTDCPFKLLQTILETSPILKTLRASIMNGPSDSELDLSCVTRLTQLTELKLTCNRNVHNLSSILTNLICLKHLHLLEVGNLKNVHFEDNFKKNDTLETLGLGNCEYLDTSFIYLLQSLTALKKLRLEKGLQWNEREILHCISTMPCLTRLELISTCITIHFEVNLSPCSNLKELIILLKLRRFPMSTNYYCVFKAAILLKDTLKKFSWSFLDDPVITLKDQYSENSIKVWYMEQLKEHLRVGMPKTWIELINLNTTIEPRI